ncbi:MAG: SDR family oxidoreductase [Acidimicrobiia bacterium]|nr:SDR family oxidoreductase [Acidimicrobiia bacterium]
MASETRTILVTGASGYVGGRLVGALVNGGHHVRCLARSPAKLTAAPWRADVEVVQGDIEGDLADAVDGVDVVYYLVHSIGEGADWSDREAAGAANLRDAAAAAGVSRIIYLGGLGEEEDTDGAVDLSRHLQSRHRVGQVLADGPISVIELRAAVIIGSGSASFEMLRYLVDVLPVMVTPKWVDTRCQPIAIRDVVRYLVDVIELDDAISGVFDIGGPDILTYREMMSVYADEAGLRSRVIIPVPVLTPRLSSLWVGLVTPLPRSLARPLVSSLVNEVVANDERILELCPGQRLGYRDSVRHALRRMSDNEVVTSWSDAESDAVSGPLPTDPEWSGGSVLRDVRQKTVRSTPDVVHHVVSGIGGTNGWYVGDWLWDLRGAFDKLIGGPGMRRSRRDPVELRVGDAVDFWRVESTEPELLRLRAEMRLPGVASLEWRIEPLDDDASRPCTRVTQVATFVPRGLWGRAYWYALAPFHTFVFPGLLDGLASEAERTTLFNEPPKAGAVESSPS